MIEWHESALCAGMDTEIFYADPQTAVELCDVCPVRMECLEDAMAAERHHRPGLRYGVRGGLTGYARYRLAQRRGEVPVPRARWSAAPEE